MYRCIKLVAVVAAAWLVWNKTSVGSYLGAFWANVQEEAKNQVPSKFELQRVRHEIAQLDADIQNMIRPVAEHMAGIAKLKKDQSQAESQIAEQKAALMTLTRDLESNHKLVLVENVYLPQERGRQRLQKNFESYKRLEAHYISLGRLLEAKESSLKATQEQLAKILTKKKEYELRLAQLEAEEETLQIARIGSHVKIDSGRATQIEAALQDIEHRHNVLRAELELRTGQSANEPAPARQPDVDVDTVRRYLERSDAQ